MKALLVFASPWLRCFVAAASELECTGLDSFDGSVLLHRDVQLHAPASSHLPVTPSAAFAELAHRTVLRAGHHLQRFEAKLEGEHKEIEALRQYLEKVLNDFGKHGSIFSELRGLFPAGSLAAEDRQVGVKFMALLRDEAFAKALHAGVTDMGRSLFAFNGRAEKQVSELLLASANSTEAELPQLVKKFFTVQQHIIATLMAKMGTDFQKVLFAVPEDYSFVSGFAGTLMKQLADGTNERVAENVKRIAETNGTRFCGDLDRLLTDEALPLMNETMQAMPLAVSFAESNIPDVAPVVQKLANQVSEIARVTFASLAKDMHTWTDQLCSLIVAAS